MTKNKTRKNTNKNFHSSGLRQKVDQMMDILYAGGVNNPMDSIEQISYLLFLRLLTERDEQLAALSKKYKRIFSGKWSRYAWGNFVTLTGDQLFDSIRSAIENLHELPDLSDTGRLLFRRATLKIYDRPTLRAVIQSVHDIDLAEHNGADIKGDMYEYLLSKISMSGTNGQFRTPRHIIDFIVEIVDPKPGRRICDPACGTAGFLISAFKHILKQNTSKADLKTGNITGDKLKPAQWKFLEQQAFTGFDNNDNMVKISILNLYLHKLEKANIDLHNPLTTTRGGTYPGPQYDCILANPPFAGKVQKESILSDLNHGINTRATELLFLKWFIDHLADKGRAGVIVPEGIIFQSQNAYKKLRKTLVDDYLWCVVSLPAGVFNPYAGVKTSVLLIDKTLAKKTDKILFVKIENDGFDLGAKRRPIDNNDLPKALDFIKDYKSAVMGGTELENTDIAHTVEKAKIGESGDWNLSGDRYQDTILAHTSEYEEVKLGDIVEIQSGYAFNSKMFNEDNGFPIIRIRNIKASFTKTKYSSEFDESYIVDNGDLLIGMDGEFNATLWQGGKALLNQRVCKLHSFNKSLKKYVFWMIERKLKEIEDSTYAVTVKHISAKQIKTIKIPLPTLDVQKAIVAEIDSYQKIIDGARQVVENYKPTIKIDPDWTMVALADVCEQDKFQILPESNEAQQLPYIGLEHIESNTGEIRRENGNNADNKIKGITFAFDNTHILYGKLRPYLNKVALPNFSGRCSTELIPIKPLKINRIFLSVLLRRNETINFVMSKKTGTRMPRADMNVLFSMKIPLPPSKEQKQIVSQIEAEQQIVNANKKLIEIYEHKIKDKIAEVWGCGTSQAAVEKKVDEMADSGLLIAEVAEHYRTDASVACLVLQNFKERGKTIREFHLQKYAYIAQQYLKLPIVSEFQPMAAGPWSRAFKNYACAYARQQQWFSLKGRNVEPGKALKAGTAEAEKILSRQRGKVLQLLDGLKRFGDSGLERWATILMVVSQLKTARKAVTRRNIQEAIDTWSGKRNKEWFTKINVSKAIDGMNQKGWIKLIGE